MCSVFQQSDTLGGAWLQPSGGAATVGHWSEGWVGEGHHVSTSDDEEEGEVDDPVGSMLGSLTRDEPDGVDMAAWCYCSQRVGEHEQEKGGDAKEQQQQGEGTDINSSDSDGADDSSDGGSEDEDAEGALGVSSRGSEEERDDDGGSSIADDEGVEDGSSSSSSGDGDDDKAGKAAQPPLQPQPQPQPDLQPQLAQHVDMGAGVGGPNAQHPAYGAMLHADERGIYWMPAGVLYTWYLDGICAD